MSTTKKPYGEIKFKTIEEYHSAQIPKVRAKLNELKLIIKSVVPEAEEIISYNMPAFKLKRNLVYYAAAKKHIGFYPSSQPIFEFKEELTSFKTSKGAILFPYEMELPVELIKKIVAFRKDVESKK